MVNVVEAVERLGISPRRMWSCLTPPKSGDFVQTFLKLSHFDSLAPSSGCSPKGNE